MAQGRPLPPLSIGEEQRQQLISWGRRRKTAQALALRARTVLLAADGLSNTAIAQRVSATLRTVGKWRRRFLEGGIDSLLDAPRPGASRKLGDEDIERVHAPTLESRPDDATHWSTRSMAARTGFSRASIHRIWRAFALAPQRSETFKLSRGVHRSTKELEQAIRNYSGHSNSNPKPLVWHKTADQILDPATRLYKRTLETRQ